jgi:SPP1 gp7 family putative phage head morphogenesis protein
VHDTRIQTQPARANAAALECTEPAAARLARCGCAAASVLALFLSPFGGDASASESHTHPHQPVKILESIRNFFQGSKKSGQSVFNAMFGSGRDTGTSEKEVSEPYKHSLWLNAGIKLVTSQLTRIPFAWFADDAMATPAANDAQRDAFWKNPALRLNETVGSSDAIEALGGWALLTGEMCVVLPESWLVSRAERTEPFRIVPPSRLRPIRERFDGDIIGWDYTDSGGRREMLIPAQVVRSIFWNPYDDARGLGAYDAARMEVAGDYFASQFARNMAASNGQQATYITTDGAGLQKEQQDQIIAALREKQRRIQRGDFAPVFLNGGLKVEDPKARSVDAAFIQQRIEHRHAIAAALGIPMSMFDIAASYSTGAASDLYRLITCTCEPFGQKVAALIGRIEALRTGRALHCSFRWSDHPIMQEARMARFEAAAKVWGTGIPWSVLNDSMRLELPEFEGDDTGFLPFSVQPVSTVLSPEPPEPVVDEPATVSELVDKAKRLMKVRIVELPVKELEAPEPPTKVTPPTQKDSVAPAAVQFGQRTAKARDKGRVRLWQKHMASQKPFANKLHSALGKVLAKHRRQILDHVASLVPVDAMPSKSPASVTRGAIDFVFDLKDFLAGIRGVFRSTIANTLTQAGEMAAEEFGAGSFTPALDWVRSYLDQRENLITDAGTATFEQIKLGIQEGIDAGDTMDELGRRVKDAFSQADRGRCEVIAQTETATAFGVARQASQEQAGITHKEWLSAQDDRVRDSHGEVDGQIVAVDEPFNVGGVQMMHPCADGAPAREVINCRCISIGSIKFDSENATNSATNHDHDKN